MRDMIAVNIVPIIATIGAIIVAASGHDGWGWLIFLALMTNCTPSSGESEDPDPLSTARTGG
jgi:hypothetical protein